jgi:hypothetical protein
VSAGLSPTDTHLSATGRQFYLALRGELPAE